MIRKCVVLSSAMMLLLLCQSIVVALTPLDVNVNGSTLADPHGAGFGYWEGSEVLTIYLRADPGDIARAEVHLPEIVIWAEIQAGPPDPWSFETSSIMPDEAFAVIFKGTITGGSGGSGGNGEWAVAVSDIDLDCDSLDLFTGPYRMPTGSDGEDEAEYSMPGSASELTGMTMFPDGEWAALRLRGHFKRSGWVSLQITHQSPSEPKLIIGEDNSQGITELTVISYPICRSEDGFQTMFELSVPAGSYEKMFYMKLTDEAGEDDVLTAMAVFVGADLDPEHGGNQVVPDEKKASDKNNVKPGNATITVFTALPEGAKGLNKDYLVAPEIVVVLKGFRLRLGGQSKEAINGDVFAWKGKVGEGNWVNLGDAVYHAENNPQPTCEYALNHANDEDITALQLEISRDNVKIAESKTRSLVVCEIDEGTLTLEGSGDYCKKAGPHAIAPPEKHLKITGRVNWTGTSRDTIKFGLIQSMTGTIHSVWEARQQYDDGDFFSMNKPPLTISYKKNIVQGAAGEVALADVKSGAQASNAYLLNGVRKDLNNNLISISSPPALGLVNHYLRYYQNFHWVRTFYHCRKNVYNVEAKVWLVVVVPTDKADLPHIYAIKQQGWTVGIDSAQDGPWSAQPQGQAGAPADDPTDYRTCDGVLYKHVEKKAVTDAMHQYYKDPAKNPLRETLLESQYRHDWGIADKQGGK